MAIDERIAEMLKQSDPFPKPGDEGYSAFVDRRYDPPLIDALADPPEEFLSDPQWTQPHGRHFDRLGNVLSLREWAVAFEDMDYRRIGFDEIGPYHVSTIWLGIDHSFGHGPPVIFESMVFANERQTKPALEPFTDEETGLTLPGFPAYDYNPDFDQRRYCTEEEALAGHAELVRQLEALVSVNPDHRPDPEAGYAPFDEQD